MEIDNKQIVKDAIWRWLFADGHLDGSTAKSFEASQLKEKVDPFELHSLALPAREYLNGTEFEKDLGKITERIKSGVFDANNETLALDYLQLAHNAYNNGHLDAGARFNWLARQCLKEEK
jgi:hypothetical protein